MAFGGRFQNFISGRRKDANSPPPYFLRFRSSKAFIISTLCLAIFTDMFLYGVIVPVVPFSLTERAGVAQDAAQHWVSVLLAVYGAGLLVSSPIAGLYADRSSSRRLPLLLGLVILAGSTVMLCLARSIGLLVAGRLLQGLAAGVVWTVGQALLVDTVGQKDIGQSMGYVSISMSVGIMVSPLLGGVVYEKAGYYAVYYMCFAVLILDIVLRLVLIEKKIAAQWDDVELDVTQQETNLEASTEKPGKEMSTPDIANADSNAEKIAARWDDVELDVTQREINLEASTEQPGKEMSTPDIENTDSNTEQIPTEPQPIGPHTRRRFKPPPVLTLLSSRRLLAALWGCFIQASIMTSFDSVLPLFVADVFHWDSTGAGLIFFPIMIPGFLAPLFGAISDRYGPRWLAVCGFLLAVPLLTVLRFVTDDRMSQKVLLCALLTLIGIALDAVMPPLMAEITYIIEAKEVQNPGIFGAKGAYGQGYGLFMMAFAAGCLVGPIFSGFIVEKSGWATMAWTLGLLSFAGAVPVLIWTGGLITEDNAKSGEERALGKPKKKKMAGEESGSPVEGEAV